MVGHTLKILQHLLQDFKSVSDRFWALCIKGLRQAKRGNAEPTRKLRSD